MGSLNQDGSKISQSRESVRNVGGANIRSADRVESEVIRERSPEAASDDLGTNADLTTSQYSTVSLSETQKITESVDETLISRESDREDFTPDPNHQPREWYGLATASGASGGGSQDLESVLAQGNTGSGIVLTGASTLQSLVINDTLQVDGIATYNNVPVFVAGATFQDNLITDSNITCTSDGSRFEYADGTSFGKHANGILEVGNGASELRAFKANRHV